MDVKELESGADPSVHWYYQTKKLPLLRSFEELARRDPGPWNCLDIGAGSGFFSETLARTCPAAIREVVQVDPAYRDQGRESLADPGTRANPRVEAGARRLAPRPGPGPEAGTDMPPIFRRRDLPPRIERSYLLLMDVLEHLEDDASLLRDIRRRARGTNSFFITVPAFRSVWSHHDVALGHYRRYTLRGLRTLLVPAGFEPARMYYIYGTVFPLVWLHRKLRSGRAAPGKSDMGPVHPVLNALLRSFNALELRLDRGNRLWGLTCVAEGSVTGG